MRATIHTLTIILAKVHGAAVGMIAKGSVVACVLRCFLFLLPNYIHDAIIMQQSLYIDKREVLQQEYSLPSTPLSSLPMGSNIHFWAFWLWFVRISYMCKYKSSDATFEPTVFIVRYM